jgi:uncharacterized MAPEG superfamily protein
MLIRISNIKDNRNPRSSDLKTKLRERLGPKTFAKYERAEACHANGMENLCVTSVTWRRFGTSADWSVSTSPLFTSAVILGNMAGLKKEGLGGLNGFITSFLALRLAYTAVYITHKTQGPTMARSALWAAGVGLCVRVIVKAAKALGGARVELWLLTFTCLSAKTSTSRARRCQFASRSVSKSDLYVSKTGMRYVLGCWPKSTLSNLKDSNLPSMTDGDAAVIRRSSLREIAVSNFPQL